MIVKNIQTGQLGTNCYLFGDEETKLCAVVDPGDEAPRIAALVRESGMELRYILVTHGHYDHVLAVADLQKTYPDAMVCVHPSEVNQTRIPNNYMQMPPVARQKDLHDGDSLPLGRLTIEVLNTPGHSPGSLCFLVGDALFAGDTLFQNSCGRTDFHGGSFAEMMQSLRRLHDLKGDYRVFPGHEAPSTLSAERQSNPYMREALTATQ